MNKKVIVIGAGIVGLATARSLAVRGYKVTVIDRSSKAIGASIRNFGMIWPVGQPEGKLYETAISSRSIWKEICADAGIWHDEVGSLHMAYAQDEWEVMTELIDSISRDRGCKLLTPAETRHLSEAIVTDNLIGSLWSPDEMIVDPRHAIAAIPNWLHEKYSVEFIWDKAVTGISYPVVYSGKKEFKADQIFVCSGADFETLYPELYTTLPLTKCKLQMMRLAAQPDSWRIGPALCGSLSLIHYKSFAVAASLPKLKVRYENEYASYLKWGIHVMVSQNQAGELTVGDSHEYGLTPDPFDKQVINTMILDYLKKFACFKDDTVIETWNGIYPKLTNGEAAIILQPEQGVTIINGLGGAGMTLSFGLCDNVVGQSYSMANTIPIAPI
jgi:FAD dependent oxidoreductase TIGR03364